MTGSVGPNSQGVQCPETGPYTANSILAVTIDNANTYYVYDLPTEGRPGQLAWVCGSVK